MSDDDLVHRLRLRQIVVRGDGGRPDRIPDVLSHQAADRIEALEKALSLAGLDELTMMREDLRRANERIEALEKVTRDQLASEGQWIESTGKLELMITLQDKLLKNQEIMQGWARDRIERYESTLREIGWRTQGLTVDECQRLARSAVARRTEGSNV